MDVMEELRVLHGATISYRGGFMRGVRIFRLGMEQVSPGYGAGMDRLFFSPLDLHARGGLILSFVHAAVPL